MFGARDDVFKSLERGERSRIDHTGSDQNVFVGKGQERAPKLVIEQCLQHRITLARTADMHEAHQHARCATNSFESAKTEALKLVVFPDLSDKHPHLALLGKQTNVESGWSTCANIGQFTQLNIGKGRAVFCIRNHRHASESPRPTTLTRPPVSAISLLQAPDTNPRAVAVAPGDAVT